MTAAHDLTRWIAEIRERLDQIEQTIAPSNDATGETLDQWFERWHADRLERGKSDERGKYEKWASPMLGHLQVESISSRDIEAWVEWIERRSLEGDLRDTTAHRIWTVVSSMMKSSYAARTRDLRVRSDNPIRDVRGPDRGTVRIGTFLYPSEFLRLATCRRVPINMRRLYAVAIYLYPRAGELAALRWEDIDLVTGRVHIHRARKNTWRKRALIIEGSTKTGEDRQFTAERSVIPLLRVMRRGAKSEYVFPSMSYDLAGQLRKYIREAGCTRADLFADDERRRPLTFHDLRATGITWQAMRGDSPTAILERVGHLHLSTTERYLRRGRLLALSRGERVFPRLPDHLLGKK